MIGGDAVAVAVVLTVLLLLVLVPQKGYDVWGCYMSPVADAYGKKGLAPVHHRLQMCQLAAADTSNVMVSAWEAAQPGYTRTLQVRAALDGTQVHCGPTLLSLQTAHVLPDACLYVLT